MYMVGINTNFNDIKLRHVSDVMEHLYNAVFNSDQTVTSVLRGENQVVSDSEF